MSQVYSIPPDSLNDKTRDVDIKACKILSTRIRAHLAHLLHNDMPSCRLKACTRLTCRPIPFDTNFCRNFTVPYSARIPIRMGEAARELLSTFLPFFLLGRPQFFMRTSPFLFIVISIEMQVYCLKEIGHTIKYNVLFH